MEINTRHAGQAHIQDQARQRITMTGRLQKLLGGSKKGAFISNRLSETRQRLSDGFIVVDNCNDWNPWIIHELSPLRPCGIFDLFTPSLCNIV